MQNKSAALSNRCCGGTSSFRLTKLWSWRHKKVMVCVFFEVFPKQLWANVWLSSVLDMWKIRPWCPHLRSRSRALRSRHLAWVKDLRYGLWRSWGRSAWHGLGRFFKSFFLLFSCLPMHLSLSVSASSFWSMQAHLPDLRQETGPTHDQCCLSEGEQFIRDLQNEMPSGVLQTTRLFYANFQFTNTASWSWKVK